MARTRRSASEEASQEASEPPSRTTRRGARRQAEPAGVTPETTPTKRGRGRPKKTNANMATISEHEESREDAPAGVPQHEDQQPENQPAPENEHQQTNNQPQPDNEENNLFAKPQRFPRVIEESLNEPSQDNQSTTTSVTHASRMDPAFVKESSSGWATDLIDLGNKAASVLHALSVSQAVSKKDRSLDSTRRLAEHIAQQDSDKSLHLRLRETSWMPLHSKFTNGQFISPDQTLQAASREDSIDYLGSGPWRPDCILFRSNLAKAAQAIMTTPEDSSERSIVMELFENNFPTAFLSHISGKKGRSKKYYPGESRLNNETFQMCLEVRTQYFISLLESNPNPLDAEWALVQIFSAEIALDQSQESQAEAPTDHFPRRFNVVFPEQDGDLLPQDLQSEVQRRMQSLRQTFTSHDKSADLDLLKEKFSWPKFQHQMIEWIRARDDELAAEIRSNGGIDEIATLFSQKTRMWHSGQGTQRPPRAFKSGRWSHALAVGKRLSEGVRERSHQTPKSQVDYDASAASEVGSSPQGFRGRVIHESEQIRLARQKHSQFFGGPERSMFDTQPEARAVSPIGDTQRSTGPSTAIAIANRTQRDMEVDVTQDDGFQHDNRHVNTTQNRQGLNAAQDARNKRRAASDAEEPAAKRTATGVVDPNLEAPRNEGSEFVNIDDDAPPSAPPGRDYNLVSAEAKLIVEETRPHKVQTRTPWSQDEVNVLLAGIAKHGPKYSKIQKEDQMFGNKLHRRDQYGLKDKARNVKVAYML